MNQTLDLRSRLARIGLPIAAVLGIAAFVIAGGRAGLFAGLDLATFDLALGYVIAVERESPVVLVPIREADLNRFGYPIGDAHLAKALERIVAAGARAVAVDLYRPDPIPPGSDALGRIAQESEIIFIRQLPSRDPSAVVAPAYVVPANQGFSELPIDVDGVTRRSLLIAWDEAGSPSLSLALRASLRFLEEEGHSLGPDPDRAEGMRLGETALPALSADFGGYVGEDDRGYQILVDPRPDLAPARRFRSARCSTAISIRRISQVAWSWLGQPRRA